MSAKEEQSPVFLRIKQVSAITNLSRSSIYYLVANEGFPKPVRISAFRSAWEKSEVVNWMRALMEARKTQPPRGNPKRPKKASRARGRPPRKVRK